MPRARQGLTEGEQECSDTASRASSQEERSGASGTLLTAEIFRQTMIQMQQHLVLQQQQFMREIIERVNPADGEAQRRIDEGPPPVVQVEEPQAELPIRLEGLERASPVTIMSHRNSDNLTNVNATKWLTT